jgi:hypothetical protein
MSQREHPISPDAGQIGHIPPAAASSPATTATKRSRTGQRLSAVFGMAAGTPAPAACPPPPTDVAPPLTWRRDGTPLRASVAQVEVADRVGDLFAEQGSLAHCVAQDFRMSAGIALVFRRRYGNVAAMRRLLPVIGSVVSFLRPGASDGSRVYALVTKATSDAKPSLEALRLALGALAADLVSRGLSVIALPRLGCGLDRLQWPAVRALIGAVFTSRVYPNAAGPWRVMCVSRPTPGPHTRSVPAVAVPEPIWHSPSRATPIAASQFFVPLLHMARDQASRLEGTWASASPPAPWPQLARDLRRSWGTWRAGHPDDVRRSVPTVDELVEAVIRRAGRRHIITSLPPALGYVEPGLQESLLGPIVGGMLPADLVYLQVYITAVLGEAFAASAGHSPTAPRQLNDCGKQCPVCEFPVSDETAVVCAAPHGAAAGGNTFHVGCVMWSVSSGPVANPSRRGWKCSACTDVADAAAVASHTVAAPPDRESDRSQPLPQPLHPVPLPSGQQRQPLPTCDNLEQAVRTMTAPAAWVLVDECVAACRAPPRRFLPSSKAGAPPPYARRLAAAAAEVVLRAAVAGNPGAQVLALNLPRVLFRRGFEIPAQIQALISGAPQPYSVPAASPRDPVEAWGARIGRAIEAGDCRATALMLEEGPDDRTLPVAEESAWLDRLFPHHPEGEVEGEAHEWARLAEEFGPELKPLRLTATGVLRWAHAKVHKGADAGGWSARLVLDLAATNKEVGALLAAFWSLPPAAWPDRRARIAAFRSASGVLLRQDGKPKPRPIAAPSVVRRVRTAAAARSARPLADAFSTARSQVGLAHGAELAAYAMIPRLMVMLGATSASADLEASFQNFWRSSIIKGVSACVRSDEAAGRPEAAAALLALVRETIADSPDLDRTSTTFSSGASRRSHALCQGCSSSPTVEAIVLATLNGRADGTLAPPIPGVVRLAAHDDFQATAMPSAPIDCLRPPDPGGGARYNPLKSVAVGPRAVEAVESGIVGSAAPYVCVFGVPVGDAGRWAKEVWLPKWERRVAGLRRIAAHAPDVAAHAAVLVGGPGAAAAHWLAHTQVPDEATRAILRRADDTWVDLFVAFAGSDPARLRTDSPELVEAVADRLFGVGPACFGHRGAAESADAVYWAGLRKAWPVVRARAAQAGISLDDLAAAAGVPSDVPSAGVSHYIADRSEREQADVAAVRAERATRCSGDAHGNTGARASSAARDAGYPNLRVEALRSSRWAVAGQLSRDGHSASLALASLFGLPLWPALGFQPPAHCRRCHAPASHLVSGPLDPAQPQRGPPRGVRAQLDDHGEHIAACLKSGPPAGAKRRHDDVTRDLAGIAAECGRPARYHDGPVFDFGPKSRPADWLDGAVCHDLNMGARIVQRVELRERDKVDKYRAQFALPEHRHLSFRPFAVDNGGEVGPAASLTLAEWAKSLAAARKISGLPTGNPTADVRVAAGRAFTRASIAQIRKWAEAPARPCVSV